MLPAACHALRAAGFSQAARASCAALAHPQQQLVQRLASHAQASSSAAAPQPQSEQRAQPAEASVLVVPLPQLSPVMTTGRLTKWLKSPGDRVELYDVLFEVDTEELTEEIFRVGKFEGTTQLVVESHEEGWLAKRLVEADDQRPLKVGTPVGVMCEDESQLSAVQQWYECPTTDVYDAAQPQVQTLPWQSFLRGPSEGKGNCCMG